MMSFLEEESPLSKKQDPTIYDFGSGNGFPGLVTAILYPTIKIVCVESDQRKCAFLKQVARLCSLSNVLVWNERVEKLPQHSVEVTLSRGFASIDKILSIGATVFCESPVVFAFKGPNWVSEVKEECSTWNIIPKSYLLPLPEGENLSRIVLKLTKKQPSS